MYNSWENKERDRSLGQILANTGGWIEKSIIKISIFANYPIVMWFIIQSIYSMYGLINGNYTKHYLFICTEETFA